MCHVLTIAHVEHMIHLHITKTCLTGLAKISDLDDGKHVGVSENSVPLNPMVNDHYPY